MMKLEEAINHCDEIINNATSCGSFDCADEHRQLKAWLQELKQHRENVNKAEQNIAEWGEEDELMLKQAIYVCHQNGYTAVENWLKSLKDRVQPKQEFGEEDEKMIRALVSMCDVWATSHQFYPNENKEMDALKTWLKSLRPQNH